MSMFIKNGTKYALGSGVNSASIKQEINTFGQSLAKAWANLSNLTATVLVAYSTQEQVSVHHKKGDTSLISELADVLSDNNQSMYSAFQKACTSIAGLKVELVQDGDDVLVKVDLTKTDRPTMLAGFDEALGKMLDKGIKDSFAKKRKAKSASSSKTNDIEKAGEVSSVSVATKVAEDTGIAEVLSTFTEAESERLKELMPLVAQLLSHVQSNPDVNGVRDLLTSTVNKLNKGFSLSSVMADKIPA